MSGGSWVEGGGREGGHEWRARSQPAVTLGEQEKFVNYVFFNRLLTSCLSRSSRCSLSKMDNSRKVELCVRNSHLGKL